eukprot:6203059-Pyramimonas_sp.AAC.1
MVAPTLIRRQPKILLLDVRRSPRGDAHTEESCSMCVVAGAFWPHRSGNDMLQDGYTICSGRTCASKEDI